MDSEAFFKGVEVGRAMRGWRTPDNAQPPTGIKMITKNGVYDVADFSKASVNVSIKDEADAAQIISAMRYEWFRFPVFSQDPSFKFTLTLNNVEADDDGYAAKAIWRVSISTLTGAFNQDDCLAYIFTPDEFTIPGGENEVVPSPLITGLGKYIAGNHVLTFTNGLVDAEANEYQLNISSKQLPNVTSQMFTGSIYQSDTSYAVKCEGAGWKSYSGPWAGYFDFTQQL